MGHVRKSCSSYRSHLQIEVERERPLWGCLKSGHLQENGWTGDHSVKQAKLGKKTSFFLSYAESGFNFTDTCFYIYLHVEGGLNGGG